VRHLSDVLVSRLFSLLRQKMSLTAGRTGRDLAFGPAGFDMSILLMVPGAGMSKAKNYSGCTIAFTMSVNRSGEALSASRLWHSFLKKSLLVIVLVIIALRRS